MTAAEAGGDKAAGAALLVAAVGTVLGMAHHPTRLDEAQLSVAVHGALLAMLWAMAFGFLHFARRRGLDRPWVLGGLVAYLFGVLANVGAATINGFVTPALAAHGAAIGRDIYTLAWETNQALDAVGVYCTGAAFILWSLDLLLERRVFARLVGLGGIGAGAVTTALLAAGAVRMNVSGALLLYTIEVAWAALLGAYILSRGAGREALAREVPAD